MAISKKSLGKVLAISMASAMAMSSLSAALVSVSAVQDPALASNGQVGFAEVDGKISADAVITTFFNKMSDIDDDVVDVIAGQKLNLNQLTSDLESSAGFVYTDSDGLEKPLTNKEYEYKVTSGTSYLKYYSKEDGKGNKAGDLVAQADKSGTATLQIKITGYADIGGGRDDKKVTMTQNVKFKVHKNNEIDLEAYSAAKADEVDFRNRPLTDADLNDLAAYGSDITFCVVQYTKATPTDFFATISPVSGKSYDPSQNNGQAEQDTLITDAITKNLKEKLGEGGIADDTTITNVLNAIKNNKALVWNEDAKAYTLNWDAIKDVKVQEAVALGEAKYNENSKAVKDAVDAFEVKNPGKVFRDDNNTLFVDTTIAGSLTGLTVKTTGGADAQIYAAGSPANLLVNAAAKAIGSGTEVFDPTNVNVLTPATDTKVKALIDEAVKAGDGAWAKVIAINGAYYLSDNTVELDALQVTPANDEVYDATKDAVAITTALNNAIAADATFKDANASSKEIGADAAKKLYVVADYATEYAKPADFKVAPYVGSTESLYTLGAKQVTYQNADSENVVVAADKVQAAYALTLEDLSSATDAQKAAIKEQLAKTENIIGVVNDSEQKLGMDYYYTGTEAFSSPKATIGADGSTSEVNIFSALDTSGDPDSYLDKTDDQAVVAIPGTPQAAFLLTFNNGVKKAGTPTNAFTDMTGTAKLYKLSQDKDAVWNVLDAKQEIKPVTKLTLREVVDPNSSYDAKTVQQVITEAELNQILNDAKTPSSGTKAAFVLGDVTTITGIRFYAGSGQELFDVTDKKGGDWVRGTKGGDKGLVRTEDGARITLSTKGKVGSGSIKVAVGHGKDTDELVLNVKTVKAVDFKGAGSINIDKSGSKTIVDDGKNEIVSNENINGFEIRGADGVIVENGNVGCIKDASNIAISGGKVASIDADDNATVTVTEDGVVGDILNAKTVTVDEGGQVGNITADADVSLTEGTIASINVDGAVDIKGGTVTGNITATGNIDISSNEDDTNDDPLDTQIGGNVTLLAKGGDSRIVINNESDDGAATLSIRGNIVAKHVDTSGNGDDATITIGDSNTTGLIQINGSVEGEVIQLGGNGLVSLAGVRAANEVERNDDDAETIESTIVFDGFNSTIAAINNFADVKVTEGTVIVKGAVGTTNLTVNSDAQIVADSITVEEDIIEGGSIVVPVGKLTVTGSVDDSPALALTGELTEGAVAFVGNRGLVDKFETGGITLKAEKLANGNYNYLISKVELNGLTAIGKDVATGVKQEKKVSVALDGTLPEGASIVWESDDADIATVAGNGADAVITGEDVGTTTVTAKIVDANGRELGYGDASFDVNVLDNATVDSIGGDIGPDDNQVDLDTKKKNMEAGQVYTFMVRGNNDVENISVTSGDTNVATVALANGADSRGALYNITAVADGKTDITVTYQGKTSKIAVKVGGFQLDTSSKKMAPGQVYSVLAKNVPADQAGNVTLAYDNNIVDVVKVNDNYNGRGVLFNVTAKAIGETEVKVTHNGETETMAVNVVENTGRLTLDTASYTMPFGGSYTIGVKVEKNGRQLSGEEVRAMISSGELVVTDSRTGSIVTTEVQANGNVRVTGRQNEGTTYVQFIVMQNGQRVTHASVGVTVQNGATAGGSSVRSISQW